MIELTEKDFLEAPGEIQFIYIMGILNNPIGSKLYQDAIKTYPEYFPKDIEYKTKWDAIPKDVHDKYWEEYHLLDKEIMKEVPPSKGIIGWSNDLEGYKKWRSKWNKAKEAGKPLHKSLHEKYYLKYGIKWNDSYYL